MLSCPCAQLIKDYAMKLYGGMDVNIHVSRSGRFNPGERASDTHCIGWVGARVSVGDTEKRNIFSSAV
jgi:hypothetical protein